MATTLLLAVSLVAGQAEVTQEAADLDAKIQSLQADRLGVAFACGVTAARDESGVPENIVAELAYLVGTSSQEKTPANDLFSSFQTANESATA